MEPDVRSETRDPMSRWRAAGRASLRWGNGPAPEERTFEEDLALLESQVSAEKPERPPRARPLMLVGLVGEDWSTLTLGVSHGCGT